jgi:hypothetical protein
MTGASKSLVEPTNPLFARFGHYEGVARAVANDGPTQCQSDRSPRHNQEYPLSLKYLSDSDKSNRNANASEFLYRLTVNGALTRKTNILKERVNPEKCII